MWNVSSLLLFLDGYIGSVWPWIAGAQAAASFVLFVSAAFALASLFKGPRSEKSQP